MTSALMDDRAMFENLRAERPGAFESIFRSYYALLVVVAEQLLGTRSTAEDVAQEVMLELWRRRDAIVLDTSLRAYLVRAARNRALNQLRHDRVSRRADPEYMRGHSVPGADRALREAELERAIRDAVRSLPDRAREAFELSRVQGLSYAEIAAVLGVSIKTVEAHMGKALRILRERLAPWLPGGAQ
ncbi:MAG TPA: RNA polymerase sigma-70 factor [Gemmatimonadales bacterium]|nr:RNA polymerase sigma-70 factor [Gemmatimonadales bacterium]